MKTQGKYRTFARTLGLAGMLGLGVLDYEARAGDDFEHVNRALAIDASLREAKKAADRGDYREEKIQREAAAAYAIQGALNRIYENNERSSRDRARDEEREQSNIIVADSFDFGYDLDGDNFLDDNEVIPVRPNSFYPAKKNLLVRVKLTNLGGLTDYLYIDFYSKKIQNNQIILEKVTPTYVDSQRISRGDWGAASFCTSQWGPGSYLFVGKRNNRSVQGEFDIDANGNVIPK